MLTGSAGARSHPPSEAMEDPLGIVGTRLDGKYLIEAAVAEGGFGRVYRARHCSLHCPVAVKVLKVPDDLGGPGRREFLEAFSREARTLARLDHPALVRAMDFGVSAAASGERVPWMVLEWLEGSTLEAHLAAREGRGGCSPAEALALLRPAIEGVARAHALGVAHRDLKPSNLMRVEGPIGLRVLDFGIARQMEPGDEASPSGETASRSMRVFSPAYASPEQLGGTRTGPWTDVHALALILTEVLTGLAPYEASTGDGGGLDLSLAVLSAERPTPRRHGVDVGAWEPVLARAAALRPGDRYPDAGSLLEALETALSGAVHRPLERSPTASSVPAAFAATQPGDAPPRPLPRVPRAAWISAALVALTLAVAGAALLGRSPPVDHREPPPTAVATAPSTPAPEPPPPVSLPPVAAAPVARELPPARRPVVHPVVARPRSETPAPSSAMVAPAPAVVAPPVVAPPVPAAPIRTPPRTVELAPGE